MDPLRHPEADALFVPAGVHESFRFTFENGDGDALYDITIAKACVVAGWTVACVEIPRAMMADIAERNEWDPARLDRVDPAIPGIGVPMLLDGAVIYALVDGMHRNARALRDGLPFKAHLLTDDAAQACLIAGPLHRMPWGRLTAGNE